MYKVKRFSQVDISSIDIRYFSYEGQKEFNIVTDIYHSGLKRTWKKYAGRGRKKIADKIYQSANRDLMDNQKFVQAYASIPKSTIKDVESKLIRQESKRLKSRVLGTELDNIKGNYTISSKNAEPSGLIDSIRSIHGDRIAKKVSNASKSSEDLIFHPSGSGTEMLAHELGHVQNAKGKNPVKRFINKVANDPNTRTDLIQLQGQQAKGVRESIKRYLKGKAVLAEETNASKNGLEMMKKHGASKEQLDDAKRILDVAGSTYKGYVKANSKMPLYNKIQIPSRRISE